ncbi:MAG TPA: hypothetical protein VEH84_06200 [Alphaproteobacteria bacterium]|nr:hypothetical protein [Alphaproteobacteria bacterium]
MKPILALAAAVLLAGCATNQELAQRRCAGAPDYAACYQQELGRLQYETALRSEHNSDRWQCEDQAEWDAPMPRYRSRRGGGAPDPLEWAFDQPFGLGASCFGLSERQCAYQVARVRERSFAQCMVRQGWVDPYNALAGRRGDRGPPGAAPRRGDPSDLSLF